MVEPLGAISTPWTMIQQAQHPDASPEMRRLCLEALCLRYREPVCEYLRVYGVSDANDRDDLTQIFFMRMLERDWLSRLDREKGSLRGYIVTSLRNFVANERLKSINKNPSSPLTRLSSRGGSVPEIPSKTEESSLEEVFNKEWAKNLIQEAIEVFKEECRTENLPHYYEVFERHDLHPQRFENPSYQDTATALGYANSRIVTNHLARARRKFRDTVRKLVRMTVSSDDVSEEEMVQLERFLETE